MADVRRCGGADEPTDKILEDKTRGVFVETDVTDRQAVRQTIDTAVDEFGGVDILVNNAGVSAAGSIDDIGFDDWQSIMDVNVTGAFNCCKQALPHLLESKGRS